MTLARLWLALVVAWTGLLLSCDGRVVSRPGVDETTNGLTATVVQAEHPVHGARVVVRNCTYAADSLAQGYTDSLGHVLIDTAGLPDSLCLDAQSGTSLAFVALDRQDSSAQAPSISLEAPIALQGQVRLPHGVTRAQIQLRGFGKNVYTDSKGIFSLVNLPPGHWDMRAVLPATETVVAQATVVLAVGDSSVVVTMETLDAPLSAWSDSAYVVLNTKASGAGIDSIMHGFPLLLHLHAAQFPKSAQANGEDLRVEDMSGRAVPFEIVLWDTLSRVATVWVRLDSVVPNDSSRVLCLRWGNPLGVSLSKPALVFDTADGWKGVWHMAYSTRDASQRARIPDATPWARDGVVHGYVNWDSGPLGRGLVFNGLQSGVSFSGKGIDLGLHDFTMEFWVKTQSLGTHIFFRGQLDTLWDHHEKILFLGKLGSGHSGAGWLPTYLTWGDPNNYTQDTAAIDSAVWEHLTLRRTMVTSDSGRAQWFVNGLPVKTLNPTTYSEADDGKDSLFLADAFGEVSRRFNGSIEEFRISGVSRSDAWIRMNATQGIASWLQVTSP